jgi:hypothetical protein
MKKIFFLTSVIAASYGLHAQNGNLGIGTNNPTSKLTVSGNSSIGTGYTGTVAPANGAIIQGNVGIGTSAPTATLQVNGNMILDTAKAYSGNNAATLVRDNTTGEVKVITTATGNSKPLSYLQYVLTNCQEDWVNDFDTKIPVSSYTMAIIGVSFLNPNSAANLLWVSGDGSSFSKTYYNPHNVYAFQSGGTWHIKADYDGGATADNTGNRGGNGTWNINCLIVNNSMIKSASAVGLNLNGSSTGAAAAPPAGL